MPFFTILMLFRGEEQLINQCLSMFVSVLCLAPDNSELRVFSPVVWRVVEDQKYRPPVENGSVPCDLC